MAVADIARDDVDEMLREEAEDVFYEDGRLAGVNARVGLQVGLQVACVVSSRLLQIPDFCLTFTQQRGAIS